MSTNKNSNLVEIDINCPSQLDMGGVIKDVHDFPGHSLRTRDAVSVVPVHYTHFDIQYNIDGQPTQVLYYTGISQEKSQIAVKPDIAGSLNNKYFFLFEGASNRMYHVWFNVGGLGTDPAPVGSIGIEIPLNTNDPAIIVAKAVELTLNNLYSTYWNSRVKNAVLEIDTVAFGETNDTVDVDTTFIFAKLQDGEQCEVARVDIDYSNGDPIYKGQVLKGYSFNAFTGKFEITGTDTTVDFDVPLAKEKFIQNISLTDMGVEYSVVMPENTNKYTIRSRETSVLRVGKESGDTSTNYITIKKGVSYSEDGLLLDTIENRTIYVQSNKDNITLEVISWV